LRSSRSTFIEPAYDRGGRHTEGAPQPTQTRTFLVGVQDLLLALLSVAVGGRILSALTTAGVTEVLLLAIVGGEAVLDDIVASAVTASDDFGNHILTLTRHSRHSSVAHYQRVYSISVLCSGLR
jgi:hypothetical protein